MADEALIYDILVGKNELSKELKNIQAQAVKKAGTGDLSKDIGAPVFRNLKGQFSQVKKGFTGAFDVGAVQGRLASANNIMRQLTDVGRLKALGVSVGGVEKRVSSMAKTFGLTGKVIQRTLKEGAVSANRFDARLLSLLFGGMALKRAFGGLLRSITDTFFKAEDETSGLVKATTRLNAAWEFLKFSIFDALNTPFFLNMIENIIQVIDHFSDMSRGAKISILAISAGLFLLGTGLMMIGQIALGWRSIFGIGGFLGGMSTMLFNIPLIGLALLLVGAVATAFKLDFEGMKDSAKTVWDAWKSPLKQMGGAIDDVAKSVGFQDKLALLGATGVIVFNSITRVLTITAVLVEIVTTSLIGLIKVIQAVGRGDLKGALEIETGGIADGIELFRKLGRVTVEASLNSERSLEKLKKIGEPLPLSKAPEFIGERGFFGVGRTVEELPELGFSQMEDAIGGVSSNLDSLLGQAGSFTTWWNSNLTPAINDSTDSLVGTEDSLVNGLQSTGTEMDILSGSKTINFIGATDQRITKINEEAAAERDLAAAQRDRLAAFAEEREEFENDRFVSSVTGG